MNNTGQIEAIRDRINITDIVREYVPSLKQTGRTFKACCPFHKEKTPSFVVNQEKGMFYCFGCQEGGDVFAFLMKIEGISFYDALKRLADKAGIKLESDKIITTADREILEIKKALAYAKDFFRANLSLKEAAQANDYIKQRGITAESIENFELGFSPNASDAFLKKAVNAGFSEYILKKAGLVTGRNTDFFFGRLMFPVKNHRGETIAFGGRILGDAMPKYLNSPETMAFSKSRVLYGLSQATRGIREKGYAVILEGYMDVLMCHQHGVTNSVAGLGTALGIEHAKLIKRYTSDTVLVLDADTAGINAALKAGKTFTEQGLNVRIVMLKGAKDPDEFLKKESKDNFDKAVAGALDLCGFHIKALGVTGKVLTAAEKSKYAAVLLETLACQSDEIIKAEWRRKIAESLEIDEGVLIRGMNKNEAVRTAVRQPNEAEKPAPFEISPCEENFLRALLKQPQLIRIADQLAQEDFMQPAVWKILKKTDRLLDEETPEPAVIAALAQEFDEISALLYKLCADGEPCNAQVFEECVKALKTQNLNRRLKMLKQEIKKHKPGHAPKELAEEIIKISTLRKNWLDK